jgi:thymidylate kinase
MNANILHTDTSFLIRALNAFGLNINSFPTRNVAKMPLAALQQWLSTDMQTVTLENTEWWKESCSRLQRIQLSTDNRIPAPLVQKLALLMQSWTAKERQVCCTAAHGDMTPWNATSRPCMPVLFELFDVVYQNNILLGNKGYKAIRRELDRLFQQPVWRQFIDLYHINTHKAEQCYLVYTLTFYFELYQQQDQWHPPVNRLLDAWNEALTVCLSKGGFAAARSLLLNDVWYLLHHGRYAAMKWGGTTFDSVPEDADIELCIEKNDAKDLVKALKQHPLLTAIRINSYSHQRQLQLVLADDSLLHIDLILSLRRKSLEFMDVRRVIAQRECNPYGVSVPRPIDDFTYAWFFYWLNGADIPERYRSIFPDWSHLFTVDAVRRKQLIKMLKSYDVNSGWKGLKSSLLYLADVCMHLLPRKGLIVTFSGVDGVGKSMVIEHIRNRVDKVLKRKVVVLRHRPSLLPILSAWHHRNLLLSLLHFAYYYADYLLGQLYIHLRYVRRGYLVLYDRYYFDFINDSSRSNINLPPAFTKWWYRFLFKPDLNFFLYANEQDIRSFTLRYMELYHTLDRRSQHAKYITIEHLALQETVRAVYFHIKMLSI